MTTETEPTMEAIKRAIEMMAQAATIISDSAAAMDAKLAELSKEQIQMKKDILEVKRLEMELRADSIDRFRNIGKNADLDFLREVDVLENDFLDKSIARARELNNLHKEMRYGEHETTFKPGEAIINRVIRG